MGFLGFQLSLAALVGSALPSALAEAGEAAANWDILVYSFLSQDRELGPEELEGECPSLLAGGGVWKATWG